MRERLTRSEFLVMCAFIALAALFLINAWFNVSEARRIDVNTHSIANNAAPSVLYLSDARTDLRNVQRLADDYSDAIGTTGPQPPNNDALREAYRSAQENLKAYLALPTYDGERALWKAIDKDLTQTTVLLNELDVAARRNDKARASDIEDNKLQPLMDEELNAIAQVVAFNSAQAGLLASRIDQIHHRSVHLAWLSSLVCVALTASVAAWAVTRTRRIRLSYETERESTMGRVEALDEFSGRVAHDVLSPLGAMDLSWALVLREYPNDEHLRSIATRARTALRQTRVLVDDLLRFARSGAAPERGAVTAVAPALGSIIDSLKLEAEAAHIELQLEPPRPLLVSCAPGVLSSMVTNLVRNAIKYMDQSSVRRVTVRAYSYDSVVRFEVEDTGPGVPVAMEREIFEPYVRGPNVKEPGIGLGLATVKRLAEAHQGVVGLLPSPHGKGALFFFELPRMEPSQVRPEDRYPSTEGSLSS